MGCSADQKKKKKYIATCKYFYIHGHMMREIQHANVYVGFLGFPMRTVITSLLQVGLNSFNMHGKMCDVSGDRILKMQNMLILYCF